jgi:fimbrial chaperone protein
MNTTYRRMRALVAAWLILSIPALAAAEFSINPISLDLGAATRSGAIVVKNEGTTKLSFQLTAMEWTQDAAGNDQYAETSDLVFYPKIMTVEAGGEGLIRAGTRKAVVPVEKTYRLYIEELPGSSAPGGDEAKGVQIKMLIRFGAPIFVGPLMAQDSMQVEKPAISAGTLGFSAHNTGNRRQVVQGIQLKGADARGQEVYAHTIADRYLLAGTNKPYTVSIPLEACQKLATLAVQVNTDRTSATNTLDVRPGMCR